MADFKSLTERISTDLADNDEAVLQPNGNDTVAPQRTRLDSLKDYFATAEPVGRERILRGYENQTGTTSTGVTSFVLPTDYTDYARLELITQAAENVSDPVVVPTHWLDLQTATGTNLPKLGVLDHAESGSRQWLTWTKSTRTLAVAG